MWTLYMKGITPRKNVQKEKKETIAFPPISKTSPTIISHSIRRRSWAGQGIRSVQDLFFSMQVSDAQRSLNKTNGLRDVSLEDCHWNIPYKRISGQTSTQIKAHLKNNLYHRRVKRVSNEAGTEEENQYILESTESFLLKSRQKPSVQEQDNTSAPQDASTSLARIFNI
ncbi:uncharacterized protein ACMZJ9_019764 [Mantella aurantiaca]